MARLAPLLRRVRSAGVPAGQGVNVVAFSGGVDSSLVAALVQEAFPANALACIGVSPALARRQLIRAREVARHIGIRLEEVRTGEGGDQQYVANAGDACYHCKTHLYSSLAAVREHAIAGTGGDAEVRLFNGTNGDDLKDPTRLGLVAASEWSVASPLDALTKDEVRAAAQEFDLPNSFDAASPCLRSRLAIGVEATERHLARTEAAEQAVAAELAGAGCNERTNMRVRTLPGDAVMIEVDNHLVDALDAVLARSRAEGEGLFWTIRRLGFLGSDVGVRAFKSGSVSKKLQKAQRA
mmetsp:Transcript_45781/g.143211  ORF Transcript_45781/g.143211 Transcript_45781/m.143211 type:complete len:296 (+) Transcript_45781:81-968(+)|eukprot:CAMPEP_0118863194 /NCGR_PEP_ID=MMETSP1163-20130328/8156_1 /TAXON_ID=124430 /ORGANISM="Phaeomonas parva, Strain CCMP2877" /LENGTH=295 /DNA_ID=CAMNT_0006797177 /DNA_START=42 /DNA_END=929 /DNA_ORIENTATION=-